MRRGVGGVEPHGLAQGRLGLGVAPLDAQQIRDRAAPA
jgi:hypothetical protein